VIQKGRRGGVRWKPTTHTRKNKNERKKKGKSTPRCLLGAGDLLVRNVTPLEHTIANGDGSNKDTATHEDTSGDEEALEASDTFILLGRRRKMRRKLLTLSDGHAEETFRHNSLIDTSDEDVEELVLDSSESDLGLGRALVIVIVVNTDLTIAVLVTREVDLNLSGEVSLGVASGDGDPVIVTNKLVPVTLTSILGARGVAHITISGKTEVIVRKGADANGSAALGVDHGNLLVDLENESTSRATEASHKEPVVGTRLSGPLDLRGTVA